MNEFIVFHNITDQNLFKYINNLSHSLQYKNVDKIIEDNNAFFILHFKNLDDLKDIDIKLITQKNFVLFIVEKDILDYFHNISIENRFILCIDGDFNKNLLEINIKGFLHYAYKIYELLIQNYELEEKIFDLAFATTDVLEQKEIIEDIAIRDGMTKLYNHAYFGDGSYPMQPVSVTEVAEIFVKSIDNEKSYNKIFPICGREKITYKQLLHIIMDITGRRRPLLPIPEIFIEIGISLFGNFSWFPITKDQFIMLKEGNVCDSDEIFRITGVDQIDFKSYLKSYLK